MSDTLSDRVLWMLRDGPMTTEQIRQELGVSRSTTNNVIKYLRGTARVCVARYERTGVKPVACFALGREDAPRPMPITPAEKNRRRKEAKARERERLLHVNPVIKRDIAASWI
jgi:hypothetical protein